MRTLLENAPHTVLVITKPISKLEDEAPMIVSYPFIAGWGGHAQKTGALTQGKGGTGVGWAASRVCHT